MIKAMELGFHDKDRAVDVMRELVEEHYVCMLSIEEQLYIVNILYAPDSNRNYVTFMSNEDFDEILLERIFDKE